MIILFGKIFPRKALCRMFQCLFELLSYKKKNLPVLGITYSSLVITIDGYVTAHLDLEGLMLRVDSLKLVSPYHSE